MTPDQPAQPPKVAVGPTTVTGYAVGVAALLAFVAGDTSEPTLEAIAAAAVAALSYLVTQVGRYVQARELARKPSAVMISMHCPLVPNGGSSAGSNTTQGEAWTAFMEHVLASAKDR